MIQRKQTLFLLVAVILGMVFYMTWQLFILQMLSSAVSLYAIFLYKRRKVQANLCFIPILACLAWYVVLAVLIQQGKLPEQLPLTAALPLVSAILCFMARKAILADEKLVRAADRIR
jgi:4-hydroxybenzoate polyprenyltransferase